MAETSKILIYVAGNPTDFPMEYYDYSNHSMQGAIPTFFRYFSEASEYEIVYWQGETPDSRIKAEEHQQVDLISTSGVKTEETPATDGKILLFELERAGQTTVYWLEATEAAPQGLTEALQSYVSIQTQAKLNGVLTEVMQAPMDLRVQKMTAGLFSLAVVSLLLVLWCMALLQRIRKQRKKELEKELTDTQTGVGNRVFLQGQYEMIPASQRILYHFFVFCYDATKIEKFKGRETLDAYQRFLAATLESSLSPESKVARVDDRSFAVLRISGDEKERQDWLNRVIHTLSTSSDFTSDTGKSLISIGGVALSSSARPFDELIALAGRAADVAARTGENYHDGDDELERVINEERELRADVDRAIKASEFELYIQFYVHAQTGAIVGGEALTRWQHPDKGFLLPERFIPFMEREGLIDRMDYLILEKACKFLEEVQEKGVESFFLSCNFSRRTFASPTFVPRCKEIIERFSFSTNRLIFEMTESISVSDFSVMLKNAEEIKEFGVRIALDDFGEKFTSFFDLQEYPIDIIKLDKRLIDNILTPKGQVILAGMIQVGHKMGLTIMAEGVEEESQVQILSEMNCDMLQGFRFYYPIPDWSARKKLLKQS